MKNIIPDLIKALQNERDDGSSWVYNMFDREEMSMIGVTDETIERIVHSNFGTNFMIGDDEEITSVSPTEFMVDVNGTLERAYALEFDTKVGILATAPVMFYYNTTSYVKGDIYILNSYAQGTWKDGVIIINPDHVDMDNVKPEKTIKTSFSNQPLFFDTGSQYVMRKTYLGSNKKEKPNSVVMELSDNFGYTPSDHCPITSDERVDNIAIYKNINKQTMWQKIFNVANDTLVAAWVFKEKDFSTFNGYINRRFIGNAADYVSKTFKTFKV